MRLHFSSSVPNHVMCVLILIEFWAVATRPMAANGLEWDMARASAEVPALQERFGFVAEQPALFERWWELCKEQRPSGKRAYDIRLLAVARASGITHILTFNVADFPTNAGVTIVHPRDLR